MEKASPGLFGYATWLQAADLTPPLRQFAVGTQCLVREVPTVELGGRHVCAESMQHQRAFAICAASSHQQQGSVIQIASLHVRPLRDQPLDDLFPPIFDVPATTNNVKRGLAAQLPVCWRLSASLWWDQVEDAMGHADVRVRALLIANAMQHIVPVVVDCSEMPDIIISVWGGIFVWEGGGGGDNYVSLHYVSLHE